jgi:hypothetical protein
MNVDWPNDGHKVILAFIFIQSKMLDSCRLEYVTGCDCEVLAPESVSKEVVVSPLLGVVTKQRLLKTIIH